MGRTVALDIKSTISYHLPAVPRALELRKLLRLLSTGQAPSFDGSDAPNAIQMHSTRVPTTYCDCTYICFEKIRVPIITPLSFFAASKDVNLGNPPKSQDCTPYVRPEWNAGKRPSHPPISPKHDQGKHPPSPPRYWHSTRTAEDPVNSTVVSCRGSHGLPKGTCQSRQ